MRTVLAILGLVFILGCGGGGQSPLTPAPPDDNPARVSFSVPYNENANQYVDVFVENLPAVYDFSMNVEFDPACIDLQGFEPADEFGAQPYTKCEPNGALGEIAVRPTAPDATDIATPNYLGRLKFAVKCGNPDPNSPFAFRNDPNMFQFRNRNQEKMNCCPDGTPKQPKQRCGGDGDKCEKCGKDGCDGGCGDNCDKCGKDGCDGGCGDNCDKCGKDGCDGGCGDNCDKCGKDGCDGGCGGNGDKCDKCGKDGCDGSCGNDNGCNCGCDQCKDKCCEDGCTCDCDKCKDGSCGGGGCSGGGGNGGCGGGGGGNGGCGGGGGGNGGCGGGGGHP